MVNHRAILRLAPHFLALGLIVSYCGSLSAQKQMCVFVGELILRPLEDGRYMELVQPYSFVQPLDTATRKEVLGTDSTAETLEWPVPAGTKVDGASIPQPLWSIFGAP